MPSTRKPRLLASARYRYALLALAAVAIAIAVLVPGHHAKAHTTGTGSPAASAGGSCALDEAHGTTVCSNSVRVHTFTTAKLQVNCPVTYPDVVKTATRTESKFLVTKWVDRHVDTSGVGYVRAGFVSLLGYWTATLDVTCAHR